MSRLLQLKHTLACLQGCQQPLHHCQRQRSVSSQLASRLQTTSKYGEHQQPQTILHPLLLHNRNAPWIEENNCVLDHTMCRQFHTAVTYQLKTAARSDPISEQNKSLRLGSGFSMPIFSHGSTSGAGTANVVHRRWNSSTRNKHGASFFSLRSLVSTPLPFMVYGLGGLIPFGSAPIYMFHFDLYDPVIASAQLVYGACILSFLGGVAWGNDLHKPRPTVKSLGYSILLPLVGWSSVLLDPNPLSFVVLMSGVACAGYADTQFGDYPDWFKNLRFLLSSVVLVCLFGTFSCYLLKNPIAKVISDSKDRTEPAK